MEEKYQNRHVFVPSISVYNAFNLLNLPYKNDFALSCLNSRITYKDLTKMAVVISKAFKELGVKKGDIISVDMPNYIQGMATFLAANRIGAAVVFLNANSSLTEITHYLNEVDSKLFVNFDKTEEENKYIKENTNVNNIITLHKTDLNLMDFNYNKENLGYSDFISYNDLGTLSKYFKGIINPYLYGGSCDAYLGFTSGTTGNPKIVVLTNKNIIATGMYCQATTNIKSGGREKALNLVSYDVPYGFITSGIMNLLCGKEVDLATDLNKDNLNDHLKGIKYLYGTPAFIELLLRNANDDLVVDNGLIFFSGGDTLTVKKYFETKEFFANHGCPDVVIANGSGNAETTATSTSAAGRVIKPETVGVPLVGSKIKIIDKETKEEKKRGESGIFCVHGEHVFDRYYNNPEATKNAKIMLDGEEYFKSDTYYIQREDDYMEVVGRDCRYFVTLANFNGISSFYKVYCDRIQNYIQEIDIVDSCAVVESYDEKLLSSPRVYVVLKSGIPKTKETIDYLFECFEHPIKDSLTNGLHQLKTYEIPTSIEFVDDLPRTRAGKIDYKLLTEDSMNKTTPKKKDMVKERKQNQ